MGCRPDVPAEASTAGTAEPQALGYPSSRAHMGVIRDLGRRLGPGALLSPARCHPHLPGSRCEVQQPGLRSLDSRANENIQAAGTQQEELLQSQSRASMYVGNCYSHVVILPGTSCLYTSEVNECEPKPTQPLLTLIIHLGSAW